MQVLELNRINGNLLFLRNFIGLYVAVALDRKDQIYGRWPRSRIVPGARYHRSPWGVSEAASAEEAIDMVQINPPRLLIMSSRFQPRNSLEFARQIKARASPTQVVVLTTYEEETCQAEAIAAGASCLPMLTLSPADFQATLALLLPHQTEPGGGEPENILWARANF